MNVYTSKTMGETVISNPYVGRGVVIGKTADGKKAAIAYFIMGRSENSRNRIFREEGQDVVIYPFDESKVEDPSLIIYSPIRVIDNKVIVTNGDQTDTIYDFIADGKCFAGALRTREFEPDAPNWTPRISGMLTMEDGDFTYEMSILKSIDEEGTGCARYHWTFPSVAGLGHFIHTYEGDGNPLPTFQGEPKRIIIPDTPEEFLSDIWANLNEQNKISIYVRYIDLETGEVTNKMINKNA